LNVKLDAHQAHHNRQPTEETPNDASRNEKLITGSSLEENDSQPDLLLDLSEFKSNAKAGSLKRFSTKIESHHKNVFYGPNLNRDTLQFIRELI